MSKRILVIASYLLFLLVSGCESLPTKSLDADDEIGLGGDKAAVVVSFTLEKSPAASEARRRVLGFNVFFQQYDPATQRLLEDGETFAYQRDNCWGSKEDECDFTEPHHQIFSVDPGYYIASLVVLQRAFYGQMVPFVAGKQDPFFGKFYIPEGASISGSEGPRFLLEGGQTTYVGDIFVPGAYPKERLTPKLRLLEEQAKDTVSQYPALRGTVKVRPFWIGRREASS